MDSPQIINPDSSTPNADALALRKPDFSKKFANLHYQSETTGEYGTIMIRQHTTVEDVLTQYCRYFPKEAKLFREDIKDANRELDESSGMSQNRSMMSLGKIPEVIHTCMKFLEGERYWDDKRNMLDFIRSHPGFMVGDHSAKKTSGNIIIRGRS